MILGSAPIRTLQRPRQRENVANQGYVRQLIFTAFGLCGIVGDTSVDP